MLVTPPKSIKLHGHDNSVKVLKLSTNSDSYHSKTPFSRILGNNPRDPIAVDFDGGPLLSKGEELSFGVKIAGFDPVNKTIFINYD